MQDIIAGYFSDNAKIDQAIAATAGGTSTITSAEFDMLGYDSLMAIGVFGTPAANNTLTLHGSDTASGEAATVATTNDATKSPLVLDVQNVQHRYIKLQCVRGTSSTIDQVILVRYNSRSKPITQATTVKVAQFNAPALA